MPQPWPTNCYRNVNFSLLGLADSGSIFRLTTPRFGVIIHTLTNQEPTVKAVVIVALLLSGCAGTQSNSNLLRDTIIIANTVRNAQQITGPGVEEGLRNQTNKIVRGY